MSIQHLVPGAPVIGTAGDALTPHQAYQRSSSTLPITTTAHTANSVFTVTLPADNGGLYNIFTLASVAGDNALTTGNPWQFSITSASITPASNVLAFIVGVSGAQFTPIDRCFNISYNGQIGNVTTFTINNTGSTTGALAAVNTFRILVQII